MKNMFPGPLPLLGSPLMRTLTFINNAVFILGYIVITIIALISIFFPPAWLPFSIIIGILFLVFRKSSMSVRYFTVEAIGAIILCTVAYFWNQHKLHVDYKTQVTKSNLMTYKSHNDFNSDDSNNESRVDKAAARLGSATYGKTFGQLMDNQKAYEQAEYDKAHPIRTPSAADLAKTKHQKREYAQKWYDAIKEKINAADNAGQQSNEFAKHVDFVSAIESIDEAKHYLAQIELDKAPEGWDDVRQSFLSGLSTWDNSLSQWKLAFSNPNSSTLNATIAGAEEIFRSVKPYLFRASYEAHLHWESLGGKPKDL